MAVSTACYILMAYGLERTSHFWLAGVFVTLFTAYALTGSLLMRLSKDQLTFLTVCAVTFRVIFIASIPALSDDFYRFLWDGRLIVMGMDPYCCTPQQVIAQHEVPGATMLYNMLSHRDTYSTYPPLVQVFSALAAWVGLDHGIRVEVMMLRLPIIFAEIGSIFLLRKILRKMRRPRRYMLLYALNPLVILELTGNLHHEAFVVVFMLICIHMMLSFSWVAAAASHALAVGSKLLPLIYLPAIFYHLRRKHRLAYLATAVFVSAVLIVPLASAGWSEGLGLYFTKLEFNPSIWAVVRTVGWWITGYNIIAFGGPALSLVAAFLIFWISWRSRLQEENVKYLGNLPMTLTWCLTIYLLFATTVHPWYLVPLVPLGIMAGVRFPLVWSGLASLTYLGYTTLGYTHHAWIGLLEYGLLGMYLALEYRRGKLNLPWQVRR